jgi:hypothetical protein
MGEALMALGILAAVLVLILAFFAGLLWILDKLVK